MTEKYSRNVFSRPRVCSVNIVESFSRLTDKWLEVYVPDFFSVFTRQRYDRRNFKRVKRKVLERLFTYLNSPYFVSPNNFINHFERRFSWDAYCEVAVQCVALRESGRYEDAEKLEQLGKRLQDLNSYEADNALHFILLLSWTGSPPNKRDDIPLSYESYHKSYRTEYRDTWFQEDDFYDFGKDLYTLQEERGDVELLNLLNQSPEVNRDKNGRSDDLKNSVFWLESGHEAHHSRETRTTLFSALTHSRTTHLDVLLQLPDLPGDPYETSVAHPTRKLVEVISEDEGFTEPGALSSASSDVGSSSQDQSEAANILLSLSVWDKALQLPSKRVLYWEQFGRYDYRLDRPFLCEQGAKAFDSLCNARIREVQIVTGTRQSFHMVPLATLGRNVRNVLLGLPSEVFLFDRATFSFTPHPHVRTSGLSPESLQSLLQRFAVAGSAYQRLNKFAKHHSKNRIEMSGGLTLQAFIRGLEAYLFTYKEAVVSFEGVEGFSPMKMWAFFNKHMAQMQTLADICLCSLAFNRPKNMPKPKFPTGLRLLSYLYELCASNNSSTAYYMLLHLLKVTSAPFIRFVRDWLFSGFCNDPYGEFLIDVDDQFLFFRDKHYWTHGFRLKMTQDNPPLFMGELAEDFFICGKGINLLRLTCPKHYLFECKAQPPELKLNFSMSHLDGVERRSATFSGQVMAYAEKRRRENLELAVEQEIEKGARLAKRRFKTEELLRRVKEMETKVKEAVAEKKKQELKTLKEEMEKSVEARRAKKQKEREEDAKLIAETEKMDKESDERVKRAKEELIAYYAKLAYEAERRERKALWMIARYQLREKRLDYLKDDELRLETEGKVEQVKVAVKSQRQGNVKQLTMDWRERRQVLKSRREQFFRGVSKPPVVKSQSSPQVPLDGASDKGSGEKDKDSLRELIGDFLPLKTEEPSGTHETVPPGERITPGQGQLDQLVKAFSGSLEKASYYGIKGENVALRLGEEQKNSSIKPETFSQPSQSSSIAPSRIQPETPTSSKDITSAAEFPLPIRQHEQSPAKDLLYPGDSAAPGYYAQKGRSRWTPVNEGSDTKNLLYPDSGVITKSTARSSYEGVTPSLSASYSRFRSTPKEEGSSTKETLYSHDSGFNETSAVVLRKTDEAIAPLDFEGSFPVGDKGTIKSILYPELKPDDHVDLGDALGYHRKYLEPESKIKALLYPETKKGEDRAAVIDRALTAEEIWLDLAVVPLRDSYAELDHEPEPHLYSNFVRSSQGVETDDAEELAVDAVENLPLEIIIERSLTIPIRAQTTLVNRAVVDYFMEDMQIRSHFEAFRKFLLLEDGEFGFALCNELFEKVASGILPRQLCTSHSMNLILNKALNQSLSATKVEFAKQLTFSLKWLPDIFSPTDISALDFLELRYKVPWPCNIVVTETCITKYNKVFSFLLQLKKVNWVLQDVFRNLKRAGQDRQANASPQLRQLQLFRHEMQHFVNNVERYLVNQILDISWQEFMVDLKTNVHNLDDIHRCHLDYIKNIIFRSLLTKNATGVLDIVTSIFSMILQFHAQLLSASWRLNPTSCLKVHPSFSVMKSTHTSFKQYAGFLFTVVSKLVQRGYQSHLDDFLLQVDFNGFYSSTEIVRTKKQ